MKIILLITFQAIYLVQKINSIKSNQFCLKPEDAANCNERYREQCGSHCAVDTQSCDEFRDLKKFILMKTTIIAALSDEKNLKYETFIKSIRKCSHTKYSIEPADFCQQEKKCFIQKELPYYSEIITLIEPIDCLCNDLFNYKCSDHYCANFKRGCSKLNDLNVKQIKKCNNIVRMKQLKLFQ